MYFSSLSLSFQGYRNQNYIAVFHIHSCVPIAEEREGRGKEGKRRERHRHKEERVSLSQQASGLLSTALGELATQLQRQPLFPQFALKMRLEMKVEFTTLF